ncbi:MAG: hypothetical protein PHD67_05370 [Oscillospiraceae bacterium]|nr:hypothetical protein [Oscillospiraceae bacterium]
MENLLKFLPWLNGALFLAGLVMMVLGAARQNRKLHTAGILTEVAFAILFLLDLLWIFASL